MTNRSSERVGAEEGFTIVELLVSLAVMAIIVTATFSALFRVYKDTGIVYSRAKQQNDGRTALEYMSKHIRQTTSITTSTSDQFEFDTYIDGVSKHVDWRVAYVDGERELQVKLGASADYHTMASGLTASDIFSYTTSGGAVTQVAVSLELTTESAALPLSTSISLRNV